MLRAGCVLIDSLLSLIRGAHEHDTVSYRVMPATVSDGHVPRTATVGYDVPYVPACRPPNHPQSLFRNEVIELRTIAIIARFIGGSDVFMYTTVYSKGLLILSSCAAAAGGVGASWRRRTWSNSTTTRRHNTTLFGCRRLRSS
jgi:hypothetical protein